jgi:serine/threonine protein kinase
MPSELQLSCSVCQSKFWVDRPSSQSGGRFNCPTCGAVVDQGQPPVDATPSGHDTSHTKDAGGQRSDGRRAAVVTGVSPANSPASSPSAGSSILRPAQQNDEIGRLGPYRVLQVLGVGGMGIVYLAEDPKLKRQIALKAIQPRYAGDYDARHRFLREAQAQAQLEHEHIVSIYQADEDNGVPYIAMPLLRGQTLAHRLKESRTLPVETVLRIGRDIAEGLAAAHARGLMHRDIKPSNIWLEAQRDRAKILDFGLARAFAQGEQIQITQSGMVIGTPAYMSPEQARGEAVDARSDLFSLGVVLYSAITGELPFKGKDTFAILTALAVDNPTPPSTLNEGVSAALSDVLLKLLARKPDDRYQSASEVAAILDEFARTEATPVASRSSPPLSAGSTTAPLRTPAPTPAPLPPASLATMPLPPAPPQPAPPQPAPPQPAPLPEEPLSLSKQPGSEKAPAHLHFRGFGCMVQITVTCVVLIAVGGLGWYYLHSPWSGDWVIIAHKANSLAELETRLGQHLKSKDFLAAFQAAEAEKGLKPDERAKLQGMIVEPLLAELKQSKDTFGTLDQLKVSEIYQAKHLSNEQADAVRQMARAALAGKVNALLDDLKKKADRDLSAGEPLLQSAMALPKSFQDKYDPSLDLDAKTLDRIEFWHKLLEIDRRLYAGKPDPAKAFDLYLDLVKSRTAFEQSLDRQTELFLKHPEISKRFKEHKSVFLAKRDAMKLVSARPALDANLAEPLIDNVDAIFAKAKSRVQSPEFDWRQRESWGPISKLAEQAVEYGPQNPKAHWLKGWAKLQEARAVRYGDPKLGSPEIAREAVYETVKLATLAEAETTLTTAATLAEKVKATDPPLAALIYLELAEAFLDAADYYAQIPYDGIRKRLQADERKKDCLQKANEWVRIAQLSAKPGQQPVAN